jgi:hypothetical protein
MPHTLDEVNDAFARIYANSRPIRSRDELEAAVRAAGLKFEEVTDEWLLSLKKGWVFLESDAPFDDERANRAYRREMMA